MYMYVRVRKGYKYSLQQHYTCVNSSYTYFHKVNGTLILGGSNGCTFILWLQVTNEYYYSEPTYMYV